MIDTKSKLRSYIPILIITILLCVSYVSVLNHDLILQNSQLTHSIYFLIFWVVSIWVSWYFTNKKEKYTQELKYEGEKFKAVANNIYGWEFWYSPSYDKLLYVSPACVCISGYTREEFETDLGLMSKIIHPDDLKYWDLHRAEHSSFTKDELEFRIKHKNGSWVWIGHICFPITSADGTLLGYRGTNKDITINKRRKEYSKLQIEIRDKAIPLTLDDFLVLAIDTAEKVTSSEIAFFHFVDSDQKTLTLQAWSTNTLKGTCTMVGKGMHYPVDTAGVWVEPVHTKHPAIHNKYETMEHKKVLPKGHVKLVRELVIPLIKRDKVVALVGVGNKSTDYDNHDVTILTELLNLIWDIILQKKLDIEKEKLESSLRQSQKMEAIGTLAGGIAHDFNNLLTVIMGYSELTLMKMSHRNESAYTGDIETIQKASERAKKLISQILTFSRKSDGKFENLQLDLPVLETIRLLRATLPSSIIIKDNIQNVGEVKADATQINQIVMNLATNAFHAMFETGGIFNIDLELKQITTLDKGFSDLKVGGYAVLTVSDTGKGIKKELIEKIFEPYFTTKPKGEGTGLGLSVIHGIVQSFGGKISVYSEVGLGSTFKIYLPISKEDKEIIAYEKTKELVYGKGETILFVDDEEPIVNLFTQILESMNYKVVGFTSPIAAFEKFVENSNKYDVIITDMTMPYITGIDLIKKIRALTPDVPCVICTGFSHLLDSRKSELLNIFYLQKPLTSKDLSNVLVEALGKSN